MVAQNGQLNLSGIMVADDVVGGDASLREIGRRVSELSDMQSCSAAQATVASQQATIAALASSCTSSASESSCSPPAASHNLWNFESGTTEGFLLVSGACGNQPQPNRGHSGSQGFYSYQCLTGSTCSTGEKDAPVCTYADKTHAFILTNVTVVNWWFNAGGGGGRLHLHSCDDDREVAALGSSTDAFSMANLDDSTHRDLLVGQHVYFSLADIRGGSTGWMAFDNLEVSGAARISPCSPPTSPSPGLWSSPRVQVASAVSSIIAGGVAHANLKGQACAHLKDGTVQCWGYNSLGVLGLGDTAHRYAPATVTALGTNVATLYKFWGMFACALMMDESVKCWGTNNNGELGLGDKDRRLTPTTVTVLGTNVKQLAPSYVSQCALLKDETVKCWGYGVHGELGLGLRVSTVTPTTVTALGTEVATLIGGYQQSCAHLKDGTVKCWGYNGYGQLGLGNTANIGTPTAVTALGTDVSTLGTPSYHNCALLKDDTVKCWGGNNCGQLGLNDTSQRLTPTTVTVLGTDVAKISMGHDHACVLLKDGTVKCWGCNRYGQLGLGDNVNRQMPTTVTALGTEVAELAAGARFTCALLKDETARCWGESLYGQLGIGAVALVPWQP
jgi:hypothetical protein